MGVIYRISCAASGKLYIGSARHPRMRWNAHLFRLRRGDHHSIHLQRAFSRHGESAFKFEIVEHVDDDNFLTAREQFWIWRHLGYLYNRSPVAGSPLGVRHSAATRAKAARRMSGNTYRRGQKIPPGWSEQSSERLKGNKHRLGKPHSERDRAKISEGLKRAFAEGLRKPVDPKVSAGNLAAYNAALRAGTIRHPSHKAERNALLLAFHQATRSLAKTAAQFGISTSSAWEIIKKYNPGQLRPRRAVA